MITLYFETCYVASMMSPGGVVVITPDLRPGDVGSSPGRGIQPIFSEEYVEREKEKKRCPYTYMHVPFHCHICVSPTCCVRLHGTRTMSALVGTCCV